MHSWSRENIRTWTILWEWIEQKWRKDSRSKSGSCAFVIYTEYIYESWIVIYIFFSPFKLSSKEKKNWVSAVFLFNLRIVILYFIDRSSKRKKARMMSIIGWSSPCWLLGKRLSIHDCLNPIHFFPSLSFINMFSKIENKTIQTYI